MKQNLEAERVWQKNYYENNFVLLIECEVGGRLVGGQKAYRAHQTVSLIVYESIDFASLHSVLANSLDMNNSLPNKQWLFNNSKH